MMLFDKRETYTARTSINMSESLAREIDNISEAEDTSRNGVLVSLLSTGVDAWEWMRENQKEVLKLKGHFGLSYRELIIRLMEVGLTIYRKEPKTWQAFAFSRDFKPPPAT